LNDIVDFLRLDAGGTRLAETVTTESIGRDTRRAWAVRGFVVLCIVLIAGTFAFRLSLLHTRAFDPDEFQHLHAAWAVHDGLLPFRDFFDHHMPGLEYLLAGTLGAFHVDTAPDDAIRFVFFARTLMWGFAVSSVVLIVFIGARCGGAVVGWLSGALVSTSIVFVGRTLEIRPDVPALAFWLAALLALMRAVPSARIDDRSRLWFATAGFCLGCGLVFNQKLLLAGPGLVVLGLSYLLLPVRPSHIARRMLDLAAFSLMCAIPLLTITAAFWWRGAFTDLWRGALVNNLHWPQEVATTDTLKWMLVRDPFLSAFAVAGLVQVTLATIRRPGAEPAAMIVLLPTLSLLGGLAAIPTPYPQYMLLVIPAGAMFGARFLWTVVSQPEWSEHGLRQPLIDPVGREPDWRPRLDRLIVGSAFAVVAVVGVAIARPFFVHPAVYPVVGLSAVIVTTTLVRSREAAAAAVVLLLACSTYSVQQLRWMDGLSNADTLQAMRFVHMSTTPSDRVLDGFTGVAWFRPQAWFYGSLHPGIRARVTAQEIRDVVGTLSSCEKQPALVILDTNVRQLSVDLPVSVSLYYRPTSIRSIWVRKETDHCAVVPSETSAPAALRAASARRDLK